MHTFADRDPQFVLEDVRVASRAILGGIGKADELTNEWFVEERLHIGARCTGAMERLLALAVDWPPSAASSTSGLRLPGRELPARGLGSRASAARLLTREAAWLADSGADAKVVHAKASLAKLFASRPPSAAPTGSSRCSAVAATYVRTRPSASSGSCASTASGRAPRRSSASSSRGRSRSAASIASSASHGRCPRDHPTRRPDGRPAWPGAPRPRGPVRASARSPSSAPARAAASPRRCATTSASWVATPRSGSSILATPSRRHADVREPRRPAGARRSGHPRGEPAACGPVRGGGGARRCAAASSSRAAASSRVAPGPQQMQRDVRRHREQEHGLTVLGPNCMGWSTGRRGARRTSATSRRISRAATSRASRSRAA